MNSKNLHIHLLPVITLAVGLCMLSALGTYVIVRGDVQTSEITRLLTLRPSTAKRQSFTAVRGTQYRIEQPVDVPATNSNAPTISSAKAAGQTVQFQIMLGQPQ